MKSILDFEKSKEANLNQKKQTSYSSISIDQVLCQLEALLNENEELNGIFFFKERK